MTTSPLFHPSAHLCHNPVRLSARTSAFLCITHHLRISYNPHRRTHACPCPLPHPHPHPRPRPRPRPRLWAAQCGTDDNDPQHHDDDKNHVDKAPEAAVVRHIDHFCVTTRLHATPDFHARQRMADELFLASQRLRLRKERFPLRRTAYRPVWTCIIIVVNVVIHWLQRAYRPCHRHIHLLRRVPDLSRLFAKESTKVLQHRQWYRLITAAFLHINTAHLLFNCGTLYAIGSGAETLFGGWAYLCIYLGGAICGNVFSVLASITSIRRSMGCSGGVFALIGAVCVHLEKNKAFIGPMARRSLRAVGVAVCANLVGGWVMPSVDGWAHFGGCAFGAAAGTWLVPRVTTQSGRGERGAAVVTVRRVGWREIAVVWTAVWVTVSMVLTKAAR